MSRRSPGLFTEYARDTAILRNNVQRFWMVAGVVFAVLLPFYLETLSDGRSWLILFSTAFVAAIGAIWLNLVTGYAGQVSLGHAFFLGHNPGDALMHGGRTGCVCPTGCGQRNVIADH